MVAVPEPPLKILHLEDNLPDRLYFVHLLEKEGVNAKVTCAETRDQFTTLLTGDAFDPVISDYSLPSFDGLTAPGVARTLRPDIPFIFFSGTMGEERATEAIVGGATDCVLKDRPLRLIGAIRRALRDAAKKAVELTRQLLLFGRRDAPHLEVLCPNGLIGGLAKMLRRLIGEDIEIRLKLSRDSGCVRVDAGQMEQVWLNLAVNARDAMPRGGRLTISTRHCELDKTYAGRHLVVQPGTYVLETSGELFSMQSLSRKVREVLVAAD